MSVEAIFGIALTAVTMVGGIAAWPYFRSRNTSATIELLNTELAVRDQALDDQKQRCKEEIAELRGELAGLRLEYAKVIAKEVVKVVREELIG